LEKTDPRQEKQASENRHIANLRYQVKSEPKVKKNVSTLCFTSDRANNALSIPFNVLGNFTEVSMPGSTATTPNI